MLFHKHIELSEAPGLYFNTPDARFVYIKLISDAQIKMVINPNKYKVEEHWRPKLPTSCTKYG